MHRFFKRVEIIVDKVIVPSLLLLMGILVLEFFFEDIAHQYHLFIEISHYVIIFVFVLDLVYKYYRIHPFKKFLKKSWPDILAVFPFSVLFRLVEGFIDLFIVSDALVNSQAVFHEAIEIEKGAGHFIQEIEKTGKISRTQKLSRLFKSFKRYPHFVRFLKSFSFFDRPVPLDKSKTSKITHINSKNASKVKITKK